MTSLHERAALIHARRAIDRAEETGETDDIIVASDAILPFRRRNVHGEFTQRLIEVALRDPDTKAIYEAVNAAFDPNRAVHVRERSSAQVADHPDALFETRGTWQINPQVLTGSGETKTTGATITFSASYIGAGILTKEELFRPQHFAGGSLQIVDHESTRDGSPVMHYLPLTDGVFGIIDFRTSNVQRRAHIGKLAGKTVSQNPQRKG
jgi:hypothetical protein